MAEMADLRMAPARYLSRHNPLVFPCLSQPSSFPLHAALFVQRGIYPYSSIFSTTSE